MDYLTVAAIGIAAGFMGGYSGIGGAPFIVFLMVTVLGMEQHAAQGTVLAMMLGPMSLPAVICAWPLLRPRLGIIGICVATYAVMSYFGGLAAYALSQPDLKVLFGALLLASGLYYALCFPERFVCSRSRARLSAMNITLTGMAVGFFGGMFGIGAGILLVPVFTSVFGLGQNEARSMSLAVLLPPVSLGAVVKYGLVEADINWWYALVLLVSYMAFNGMGARVGHGHEPERLKRVLGVLLGLAGAILIYNR